jgi:hypothetical protein
MPDPQTNHRNIYKAGRAEMSSSNAHFDDRSGNHGIDRLIRNLQILMMLEKQPYGFNEWGLYSYIA